MKVTNKMQRYRLVYFSLSAVQVSGNVYAHRQEHFTVFTVPDDWLTVHLIIILVDVQLDAKNSYLFTYNTFIKFLYMFRALPCSSTGGLRRNCIYAASGIVTLCR
jgi:hypothetical protein